MAKNINCKYNYWLGRCNNENVKKSLLGIGARLCTEYEPGFKECPFREPYTLPSARRVKICNRPRLKKEEGAKKEIFDLILKELERAERLHPAWPNDYIHQVAIIAEECGEALKEANNLRLKCGDVNRLIKELVQTGAMVLRALIQLRNITSDKTITSDKNAAITGN